MISLPHLGSKQPFVIGCATAVRALMLRRDIALTANHCVKRANLLVARYIGYLPSQLGYRQKAGLLQCQAIIGIGNNSYNRVSHGPDDALNGFVLINKAGVLTYTDGLENGFYVPNDGRAIVSYRNGKNEIGYVASVNNKNAKVFKENIRAGARGGRSVGVSTGSRWVATASIGKVS